ncbi:FecR domain-containing protein [Alphaproteobacteria bacterium LSUCC0684]
MDKKSVYTAAARFLARPLMVPFIMLAMAALIPDAVAQITRQVSGVVAASTSPVEVRFTDEGGGNIGRLASTGDQIFLDDEVVTGPETSAQILLKDQSVISIGPSSAITIDRFVYDPDDAATSSLVASISRGTFKFISGRIAKAGSGEMKLNLPNAVASIRGTSGAGRVGDDGTTEIALLSGVISVSSAAAPSPVDLLSSGWGVTISPGGGIGAPELLPADVLDSIIAGAEFIQPANSEVSSPASASAGGESSESVVQGGNLADGAEAGSLATLTPAELEERLAGAETLDEAIATIAAVLGSEDEGGSLRVEDVGRIVLENEHLLSLANIDPALLAPEESVGVNISTALLSYALEGGEPQWMTVMSENGNTLVGNPSPLPDYADLVSRIYTGSVHFAQTGLELPNAGDTAADTGMADYDITFSYDTLTFTGTYRVYDLVMGGRSYTDGSETSFTAQLHDQAANADERIFKYAQFDAAGNLSASGNQDENGNGLLDTGETLEGLTIDRSVLSQAGSSDYEGHVSLGGHFGSISNGISAIDGNFGGISVAVDEVDTTGVTPGFTGNSVSGIQYEIGEVSQP